jgi:hypothetical protein
MRIKGFNKFNEAVNEAKKSKIAKVVDDGHSKVVLYRLTSHPVLDLSQPGDYYLYVKADIDPSMLDKKGKEMFIITVSTSSSNIDLDKSEIECAKHDLDSVVVVKDDKKCEVVSVEPYKK